LRLLIVEDEMLISLLIETMVRELGHEPVACVHSVPAALDVLSRNAVDAAMLDVNIGGMRVFPVAEALQSRAIPFAFLTGYGAQAVPPRFSDIAVMQKPFTESDLADAITLLQRARFPEGIRAAS
jgi:two-component SAPR family response regulator